MFKLIIPISLAFMFSLGHLFDEGVNIVVHAPDSVNAGQEFVVDVVLKKSNVDGFSRYIQDLPEGLLAVADSTLNAEFSFEENKVRFIWIKLPAEEEIKIRYRIVVSENLKGTFKLGGKFSYIENNERKIVDVAEQKVTIIPSPIVDPALIVDITPGATSGTSGNNVASNTIDTAKAINEIKISKEVISPYQGSVLCIRQKPEKSSSGSTAGYKVNVLVHKGSMEKYLKVEEEILEGYTAVALETESGMFTADEKTAKFLWIKAPDKSDFMVSYMLIPKDPKNTAEPVMKGDLSYIVKNKPYVSQIVPRNENLSRLSKSELQKLIAKVANENKKVKTISSEKQVIVSTGKNKRYYPKHHSNQVEPENGVYFRVQVAAGHKPINTRSYFRRMRITEDIKTEEHEGWYKYSIGSFREYQAARDFRVRIWNTTQAKDAFICAYNNGARITVQEALMISNQSWLK